MYNYVLVCPRLLLVLYVPGTAGLHGTAESQLMNIVNAFRSVLFQRADETSGRSDLGVLWVDVDLLRAMSKVLVQVTDFQAGRGL